MNTANSKQGQRDTPTGQFTARLDKMCKCGHILGSHAAAGPIKTRQCMAHECEVGATDCGCEGFRAAKLSCAKV